jgi:transposase
MVHDGARISLDAKERRDLEQALHETRVVRTYRRLKAVQLVADGYRIEEVARLCEVAPSSVYNYLHAFWAGGAAALEDAPRTGRPRKLPPDYARGPESRAAWQRLLDRRPSTIRELGTPSHIWTLALLARYMAVVHGAQVAEATIFNTLTRAGFRRGRTKLTVTSPDPAYESKRRRVEALGKAPGPES